MTATTTEMKLLEPSPTKVLQKVKSSAIKKKLAPPLEVLVPTGEEAIVAGNPDGVGETTVKQKKKINK